MRQLHYFAKHNIKEDLDQKPLIRADYSILWEEYKDCNRLILIINIINPVNKLPHSIW